jgi:BirA family biotin operon repressor/biotin-[acetyl-CoA-carboxylase] ligase
VDAYDHLPSTQDVAMEAAREGAAGRLAILAQRQSAGRGRGGRAWQAPQGNLNFSALLRPGRGFRHQGALSLLAGLALHDAVASVLPTEAALMLKWPNDLLLDGAKLAGILIDSALATDGTPDWVVIGIGVNIAVAPVVEGRRTACVKDAGAVITPQALAAALAAGLDRWMAADEGAIRAAWLRRAHAPGTIISVRTRDRLLEGAFLGLSPDGGLILDGHGAPISVGEVQMSPASLVEAG